MPVIGCCSREDNDTPCHDVHSLCSMQIFLRTEAMVSLVELFDSMDKKVICDMLYIVMNVYFLIRGPGSFSGNDSAT